MFISKNTDINLTKLYFSPISIENIKGLISLIELIVSTTAMRAANFCLNYGKDSKYSQIQEILGDLNFIDLEYLEIVDEKDEQLIVISQPFKRLVLDCLVFECLIVSKNDDQFRQEIVLIERVSEVVDLHYGYARKLRTDYLPSNETKIKKNIFGSQSVAVSKAEEGWFVNPKQICDNAFKRIYPVNYWTEDIVNNIKDLGIVISERAKNSSNIYTFDKESQVHLLENNRKFKDVFVFRDD